MPCSHGHVQASTNYLCSLPSAVIATVFICFYFSLIVLVYLFFHYLTGSAAHRICMYLQPSRCWHLKLCCGTDGVKVDSWNTRSSASIKAAATEVFASSVLQTCSSWEHFCICGATPTAFPPNFISVISSKKCVLSNAEPLKEALNRTMC